MAFPNTITTSPPGCVTQINCPDENGCIPGVCPDITISQHSTTPIVKISVNDENGPLDLTGLIAEASMWFNTKLKKDISETDTIISFSCNIGFNLALKNDIIIVDRPRSPEHMEIIGFDEINKTITVQRGVNGTQPSSYKKNTKLKVFRFISAPALTEMVYEDEENLDGKILCNQLIASYLIYEWSSIDVCLSGCWCFVFTLLQVSANNIIIPSIIPDCYLGLGILSRSVVPACGYLSVKICENPVAEI